MDFYRDSVDVVFRAMTKEAVKESQMYAEMWLMLPSRHLITPAVRLIRDELKQVIESKRQRLINTYILTEREWPVSNEI